jgi:hypothetical protein
MEINPSTSPRYVRMYTIALANDAMRIPLYYYLYTVQYHDISVVAIVGASQCLFWVLKIVLVALLCATFISTGLLDPKTHILSS